MSRPLQATLLEWEGLPIPRALLCFRARVRVVKGRLGPEAALRREEGEIVNLPEIAEHSAKRLGGRVTLAFKGERFTNLQFLDWARRIYGGLADLELGWGKVAVVCLANHPLVYPVFQGIFRTGATAVPVMPQIAVPEIRRILSESELIDHVRASTSPFKAPSRIWSVDARPKTGVGKILRRELREGAATESKR